VGGAQKISVHPEAELRGCLFQTPRALVFVKTYENFLFCFFPVISVIYHKKKRGQAFKIVKYSLLQVFWFWIWLQKFAVEHILQTHYKISHGSFHLGECLLPRASLNMRVIVWGPRPEVMVTHGSKAFFTALFSFYLNGGGLMWTDRSLQLRNINDCPLRGGAFKFKENNLAVRSVAEKQGMICEKVPGIFSIFSDTMNCAIYTWYAFLGGGDDTHVSPCI
jgi:hypothetical protein